LELPAQPELAAAWRQIRTELRSSVGDSTFDIWLAGVEVADWDGVTLALTAPPATRAWVAKRFGRILESCVHTVLGSDTRVRFASAPGTDRRQEATPEPRSTFNPRYSFSQFIIGDGNRLAHAAALAVAEGPSQAFNPLFLHAPPGLGKTHLLHAIGNYLQAFGDGATVRYTTVEAFTNHFIAALSSRSIDRFKHAYRDADVLLIDDVQFLASKAKTEEEFFHTFNALQDNNRQLVVTCDRLPRQLTAVEERLRERFEAGLVAHIQPPDFPTRVAILRKRVLLDQITLADDQVLELIAERVTDNIRSLEGALIRIVAHHSLSGRPIDINQATEILDEMYPQKSSTRLTVQKIQTVVAGRHQISIDELVSSSRAARVAWPRQMAMFLARELTRTSLNEIGAAFGGRNHATILHACKRVSDRQAIEPEIAADLAELTSHLTSSEGDRSY
jgi:chromosomal replication initiator protein